MEENYGHKPVLLHECLGALAIKPDGIYVEARSVAPDIRSRSCTA